MDDCGKEVNMWFVEKTGNEGNRRDIKTDISTIREIKSADTLKQHGFSRTVITYNPVNSAAFTRQRNVVQHGMAAKLFCDMFYTNGFSHD